MVFFPVLTRCACACACACVCVCACVCERERERERKRESVKPLAFVKAISLKANTGLAVAVLPFQETHQSQELTLAGEPNDVTYLFCSKLLTATSSNHSLHSNFSQFGWLAVSVYRTWHQNFLTHRPN